MKKITLYLGLVLIGFLISMPYFADAQSWLWAQQGTGASGGSIQDIFGCSTDHSNNVYFTGMFNESVTFGATPALSYNCNYSNILVVKYDAAGNAVWARKAGDTSGCAYHNNCGYSTATDAAGDVYVTGTFEYTVKFGALSVTEVPGYSLHTTDMFIAKYNTNGVEQWVRSAGSTENDVGYDVAVDGSGNVYVAGYFYGSIITFGTHTLANSGSGDAFLVKYDASGNVLWAKRGGGTGSITLAHGVATDGSGNVYLTGEHAGTTPISFGSYSIASVQGEDFFLVKYDSSGNEQWVSGPQAGPGCCGLYNYSNGIAADAIGNVYITGVFESSGQGLTIGSTVLHSSAGGDNMFLAKFNSAGSVQWAVQNQTAQVAVNNPGYDISISPATGHLFLFGVMYTTATFGTLTLSGGIETAYIVEYDTSGVALCGSSLPGGAEDKSGIAADSYGNAYIAGDFDNTTFVVGSTTLTAPANVENAYVAKWASCTTVSAPPPVADLQSSDSSICAYDCINFTDLSTNATSWQWSFQGGTPSSSTDQNPQSICYFASGNFDVTLIASNSGGSDTLKVDSLIKVATSPPTPTITQSGDTLFCSMDTSYTSYQWYAGNDMIPGDTGTYIEISSNGNYNVKVNNKNDCSTSVGIIVLGVQNLLNDNSISISPNPATDQLMVNGNLLNGKSNLKIYDVIGQTLFASEEIINAPFNRTIDITRFPRGVYFVQIANDGGRWIGRFVKE